MNIDNQLPEELVAQPTVAEVDSVDQVTLPDTEQNVTAPDDSFVMESHEPEGKQNFNIQVPYSKPLTSEFKYTEETAYMPSASNKQTEAKIKDIPRTSLAETKEGKEWVGAINAGTETVVYSDGFEKAANRDDANWEQGVSSAQGILTAASVTFKQDQGTKFTGESARVRIRQALKLGTIFNVPLWHSGFWIRIKAPGEGALLDLYRQINADKIRLGRASYGLMFSNNTSYSSRILLDFVIEHMYESSLSIAEGDSIRNYIKTPDLPLLLWGLACSIYPNGFQYTRACITDPVKCNHVVKEKLDLSKLQWTDSSALTKHQLNHMTKRQRGSMTIESLARYQEEFIRGQNRKVQLSDQVSITLKIPTIVEHIDSGYRWVNAIEESYGKALIQDVNKRDDFLLSQGRATVMRQYGHFVESIEVDGETYNDIDTIEGTLDDLTCSDELRDAFMDKVTEYLDESLVSMIAIPTYTCPKCGGDQVSSKEHKRHANLIPLDISQTFFTLLVSRLRKIERR